MIKVIYINFDKINYHFDFQNLLTIKTIIN